MKLRLICHGMMLFWYKKPSSDGAEDDGYRILIPQGYRAGHLMHDLRFGVGTGVPVPHPWLRLSSTGPVSPKAFQLTFGAGPRHHRADEIPDPDENLSFYDNQDYKAIESANGIAYAIHVPYPYAETPIRVATYQRAPYVSRDVVRGLGVNPRRIVSARILTFEIRDPGVAVQLYDLSSQQSSPVVAAPIADGLTLHLYSEPADPPGEHEDHTKILNGMLELYKKNTQTSSAFDLELDEGRQATLDPDDLKLPEGLSFRDLLHLWELKALDNHGHSFKQGRARYVDPAECGQGGGC